MSSPSFTHSIDTGAFQAEDNSRSNRNDENLVHSSKSNILNNLTLKLIDNYKIYNPELKIVDKLPGRILTQPSEPGPNNSDDNSDGNLICRVHDCLNSEMYEYTVLDLLGTGTFGQVFRCQITSTGELVAVKVVKGKPAYRTQGLLEVKIAKLLNKNGDPEDKKHIVRILDSFEFKGHICIVFELLGCSLLDLLTQNQFRGLPLQTVQKYTKQLLLSLVVLQEVSVIHCDLKPENILIINKKSEQKKEKVEITSNSTSLLSNQLKLQSKEGSSANVGDLKLIDFGSACFEGKTMYSYIQSRFYRSPEVLLGIPYNGAIDMWSLACVCAEMFVGLPIFPGVSQHNQLCRIVEMLGPIPDFMIRQGKNGPKFFLPVTPAQFPYPAANSNPNRPFQSLMNLPIPSNDLPSRSTTSSSSSQHVANKLHSATAAAAAAAVPSTAKSSSYRLKTPEEYAFENSTTVPTFKKYLKYDFLDDIIMRCPPPKKSKLNEQQVIEEKEKRRYFLDFLTGLFNLNPFERWTAKQALSHPFIADFERIGLQKDGNVEVQSDTLLASSDLKRNINNQSYNTTFNSNDVFSVTIPMHQEIKQSHEIHTTTIVSDEIIVTISPPSQQLHPKSSPSPLLPYIPPEDPIQHTRYQLFHQKLLGNSSNINSSTSTSVSVSVSTSSTNITKEEINSGREFRLLKKTDRRESEPIGTHSRRETEKRNISISSAIPVPGPPAQQIPPVPYVLPDQMPSSVPNGSSFFWPSFGHQPSTSTVLSPQTQTQAQQLSPEKQGSTQDQKRCYYPLYTPEEYQQLQLQLLQQQQQQHNYPGIGTQSNLKTSMNSSQWNPSQHQVPQGYQMPPRSQLSYSVMNQSSSQRVDTIHAETGGIPIPSSNKHSNLGSHSASSSMSSSYTYSASYSGAYPSLAGMTGNTTGGTDFGHALNRSDIDESRYLQSYAQQQSPQSYSPQSPLSYSPGSIMGSSYLSSSPMGSVMSPLRVGSYSNTGISPQHRDDKIGKNGSKIPSLASMHYDPSHHLSGIGINPGISMATSPGGMNSGIPIRNTADGGTHHLQRRPSDASKHENLTNQSQRSDHSGQYHYPPTYPEMNQSHTHLPHQSGGHNYPRGFSEFETGKPLSYGRYTTNSNNSQSISQHEAEYQSNNSKGHGRGQYHISSSPSSSTTSNSTRSQATGPVTVKITGTGGVGGVGVVVGVEHDSDVLELNQGSSRNQNVQMQPQHQQPPVSALTAALAQASLAPPPQLSQQLPPPYPQHYHHHHPPAGAASVVAAAAPSQYHHQPHSDRQK